MKVMITAPEVMITAPEVMINNTYKDSRRSISVLNEKLVAYTCKEKGKSSHTFKLRTKVLTFLWKIIYNKFS